MVVLDNLHWTADQRSGAGAKAEGAFTAGDVIVNGQKYPGSADQLATVFDAINAALAPTGLHVTLPVAHKTANGIAVPPLSIGIDNSALGASVINPVLTATQPVQEQIKNILFGISCKFGTIFTVEDIVLSAVDGTGGARPAARRSQRVLGRNLLRKPVRQRQPRQQLGRARLVVSARHDLVDRGRPARRGTPADDRWCRLGARQHHRSSPATADLVVLRDDEPGALAALQRRQRARRRPARAGGSGRNRRGRLAGDAQAPTAARSWTSELYI